MRLPFPPGKTIFAKTALNGQSRDRDLANYKTVMEII